jgi:hypothetical protein
MSAQLKVVVVAIDNQSLQKVVSKSMLSLEMKILTKHETERQFSGQMKL